MERNGYRTRRADAYRHVVYFVAALVVAAFAVFQLRYYLTAFDERILALECRSAVATAELAKDVVVDLFIIWPVLLVLALLKIGIMQHKASHRNTVNDTQMRPEAHTSRTDKEL